MTPQEKQEWWGRTMVALENRDPRVHLALLTALIARHGTLEQCSTGHTHVIERITMEELLHIVNKYHFGCRVPETGIIEVQALGKEEGDGKEIGQRGGSRRR